MIDQGRIVETGTHDQLIIQQGLYARLAQSQDLAQDLDPKPEALS